MDELQTWKVIETTEVVSDLSKYIDYLLNVKRNSQAANAVLPDYEETIERLKGVAGSLGLMKNPVFANKGYRIIRFKDHDYYLIYRMHDNVAVVYQMLHDLQDREKSIR